MNQIAKTMIKQVPCLILARGGSKGIPKKNLKPLLEKPLIGWTIETAKKCKLISDIWVSTDCQEIAEVSKKFGANVINRPTELAQDDSLDYDSFLHALKYINGIDEIVHLRATTPITSPDIIDLAIEYYFQNKNSCSSLRSGHKMSESIFKFFTLEEKYFNSLSNSHFMGRQNVVSTYIPNGYVDIIKIDTISRTSSLHGDKILAFETEVVIEIDTVEDFKYLEYKLKNEK